MDISFFRCMLNLLLPLLWILFRSYTCEIISDKASVRQNFVNKNDTYRRLWSVEKFAATICVMECVRDTECASVLYNKVTKVCQAHSVTLGNPFVAFDEPDTQYFVRSFGEHYIGDSCVTATDCWTINTECRQGLCQCIPGYSFSPKTQECKVCDQYDDKNFMTITDHYITGENMEMFSSVTLEDCKRLCLTRTAYLCVTFEFLYPGTCALQKVTVLDFPHKWTTSAGVDETLYSQRDCA
ncbi:hypothetical protein ACF0H5_006176 [Mactra antiquata]